MNTSLKASGITSPSVLLIITVLSALLVPVITLKYSYNKVSVAASGIGFLILAAASAFLWIASGRMSRQGNATVIRQAINVGIALGLLWIAEISINNFIAPPLPARDMIDDSFWAVIALSIFVFAILCAYRTERIRSGVAVGVWSGFVSGVLACSMALAMIVFGMHFITHDPLNVAEWTSRGTDNSAPTMAAYFAYETFAGAFLHLIVLGICMGGLLGGLGGLIGKGICTANRLRQRSG